MIAKQMVWQGKRYDTGDTLVLMRDEGNLWAGLPLYLDEVNHSPDGFEWGNGGSGPSQLAYAILRTYFELAEGHNPDMAKSLALNYYYDFKVEFVNKWTKEWIVPSSVIETWVWGMED